MSSRAASWLLAGLALSGVAAAETIVVDGQVAVRATNIERPSRGATMASVEQRFGAPNSKHAAVGEPPITRWDYAHFSVFFERDRVIHAVATGS
ncbi:MAG: hypothetical protein NAOJABEB_01698 [Steroidobacteraceae bacterium]|nr:hypothetical protein [Steroidobacteraceae bacterium]